MRALIFILLFGLCGCASLQRLTNSDHLSWQEHAASEKEKSDAAMAEYQRIENIKSGKNSILPGEKMVDVTNRLGTPDRVDFGPTKTTHWYDDHEEPFYVVYDKEGLVQAKVTDEYTINSRKQIQAVHESEMRTRAQMSQIQSEQSHMATVQALQGLQIYSQQNEQPKQWIQIPTRSNNWNGRGYR